MEAFSGRLKEGENLLMTFHKLTLVNFPTSILVAVLTGRNEASDKSRLVAFFKYNKRKLKRARHKVVTTCGAIL